MVDEAGAPGFIHAPEEIEARLRDALARGELPDWALYLGEQGAANWLGLDRSSGFGVASRLTLLLKERLPALARRVPSDVTLISIGPGSGQKDRLILQALGGGARRYVPADPSAEMLAAASTAVADLDVEVAPAVAFLDDRDLPHLAARFGRPLLLTLLGNTFSNFDPDEALGVVRRTLQPGDLFLFDAETRPDRLKSPGEQEEWRRRVEREYQSSLNNRFNIDPLIRRGVAPEACRFALSLERIEAGPPASYRTRKEITILKDGPVRIDRTDIELRAGDVLRMGFTWKHTPPAIGRHLDDNGFETLMFAESPDGDGLLALAAVATVPGG